MRVTDEMVEALVKSIERQVKKRRGVVLEANSRKVCIDGEFVPKAALTAALAQSGEAEPVATEWPKLSNGDLACGCPTIEHCDGSCAPYIGRKTDPAPQPSGPVGWTSSDHLEFLRSETPSAATIHNKPNEDMGWTIPLYTHPAPQPSGPVNALDKDAVARALHAVDCAEADRERKIDRLPPVEKWADPWLPSGKAQLDALYRRADTFLSALSAEQQVTWGPIETAPKDGTKFLGYGSYLYPGDDHVTEYIEVIEYSGDPEWPWEGQGGKGRPEVFSHWQPLPAAPTAGGEDA